MGGNNTEQTVTKSSFSNEAAPWEPMQGYMKSTAGDADALYRSGVGSKVFKGTTVTPWSDKTTSGMQGMMNFSNNAGTQSAVAKPFQSYSGMMDVLSPIAKGDFTNDTSFNRTLGAAQEAARSNVDLSLSSMGRYGSGSHARTLSREIGDLTNQAMLDRQNWATGAIQGVGDRMPSAFTTALMPEQTKMTVGAMDEDLASRLKADEIRIFDAEQNLPWTNLARANAIFTGAGALGNTTSGGSTSTVLSPSTRPSMGQQALGFGTSLAGSALGLK